MGVTAGIFLASILQKEMRYLVYIRYLCSQRTLSELRRRIDNMYTMVQNRNALWYTEETSSALYPTYTQFSNRDNSSIGGDYKCFKVPARTITLSEYNYVNFAEYLDL